MRLVSRRTPTDGRPPITVVRRDDTHRLIASRYRVENVASVVSASQVPDILEARDLTSERSTGERNRLLGIGTRELVLGVPNDRIINAAFCYSHPRGGRFHSPDRGAWYSAFDIETSQAEVAFHQTVVLAELK